MKSTGFSCNACEYNEFISDNLAQLFVPKIDRSFYW